MNRVKHSHIVPEFYLHYFTNANSKIYVFDKQNFKSFESKPNKIAKQSGFYDLDFIEDQIERQIIEHRLGDLESNTAPIYKQIIDRLEADSFKGFTTDERSVLSKFIYSQMIRTEGSRNLLEQAEELLINKVKETTNESQFQDFLSKRQKNDPKLQQLYMLASDFENVGKAFADKFWIIYRNKTNYNFCTSDHPVNTYDHGVFPNTQHEIFLPLTPNYVLSLCEKNQFLGFEKSDNKIVDLTDKENIKWYNSLMIINSERQIYDVLNNFKFVKKQLVNFPDNRLLNKKRITSQ